QGQDRRRHSKGLRMITKVMMPKLSEAMETGKVIKWLKKEGDPIKGGDVIAEIETDKANVEIEAFGSGVLRKILVGEGGQVPAGGGGRIKASPLARKVAAQSGVDLRLLQGTGPGGRIVRRDVETAAASPVPAVAAAAPAPAGPVAPAPARPRFVIPHPQFVIPQRTDAEFEDRPLSPMRAIIAKR